MTEEEIIIKCKEGDMEAYGKLVKKHMKKAYNVALYFSRDSNDAWDISQTAFLKAWKAIKKFNTDKPFFPWLYVIIKNESMKIFRKKRRKINNKPLPVKTVDEPSSILEKKEEIERLKKSIGKLDKEKREIIYMRHFAEMSYKEISESLKIPVGTVMSRLYYAREELLKEFTNG